MWCTLAQIYRRFEEIYCLHLQGRPQIRDKDLQVSHKNIREFPRKMQCTGTYVEAWVAQSL